MSLQVCDISKSFFGVPVLRSVRLTIQPGEILGLIGENGAGKSTLMNILGGNLQADAGKVLLNGAPFAPRSPREALTAGVAMVHQELNLFPNLSVADNLFLTNYPQRSGVIARAKLLTGAQQAMRRVGLDASPSTRLGSLSAGEQQLVEIAKSLTLGATILLLDEPTTSLSDRECSRFFHLIHEFAEDGHAIVLITHAIDDVMRHCDRVAVLRDGEMICVQQVTETNRDRLVAEMVGRSLPQLFPSRAKKSSVGAPILQVKSLSKPRTVSDVSLTIHRGELVGLFGLMGSGRSELARMVMGLDTHQSGEVVMSGKVLRGGPRSRIARGLGLVTENRRSDGIIADSSVEENLALVVIDELAGFGGRIDQGRLGTAIQSQRNHVRLQEHLQDTQLLKDAQRRQSAEAGGRQMVTRET